MNERGKSDGPIVPKSATNKGRDDKRPAETREERGSTKGSSAKQTRVRAPHREALQHALDRVREAAARDRKQQFTTLWHHVYDPMRLRQEYLDLKRSAAPGIDGMTWEAYGGDLEGNLDDLSGRLKRGALSTTTTSPHQRQLLLPKATLAVEVSSL